MYIFGVVCVIDRCRWRDVLFLEYKYVRTVHTRTHKCTLQVYEIVEISRGDVVDALVHARTYTCFMHTRQHRINMMSIRRRRRRRRRRCR